MPKFGQIKIPQHRTFAKQRNTTVSKPCQKNTNTKQQKQTQTNTKNKRKKKRKEKKILSKQNPRYRDFMKKRPLKLRSKGPNECFWNFF